MSRNYPRLSIEEFGTHALKTGDLDPTYIALSKMEWSDHQRARWLLAYWCLYHCGVASYLSEFEGQEFWDKLGEAADNKTAPVEGIDRWPRGSERRHWRGGQAIASFNELRSEYINPLAMVDYICGEKLSLPFSEISERVQEHRGFGPWIAFKVGDMIDRLGIREVSFDNADVFMFKDPAMAAKMLFAERTGLSIAGVKDGKVKVKDSVIPEVVKFLEDYFKDFTAPPIHDRPVGLQEVETILCKWKSHLNGHYPLNNDIEEINDGLQPWLFCDTAKEFHYHMPKGE